jgi:hypothetical protein
MKSPLRYTVKIIGLLFFILILCDNILKSQSLIKSSTHLPPYYSTPYTIDGNGNLTFGTTSGNLLMGTSSIGIGTSPTARLHVFTNNNFSSQPLVQTEVRNGMLGWVASIQHCILVDNIKYGIYQTSISTSGLLNYFQDPVKISHVTIGDNGTSGSLIATDLYIDSLTFKLDPTQSTMDAAFPLMINTLGIRVRSNLITDNFQMLTGAGRDKILASDAYGNGTWTDPSLVLNQYWQANTHGGIYTTYSHVGIGTNAPSRSLEICHTDENGGIVLNQVADNTTYDASEIRFERSGVEKFATGYSVDYTGHPRPYYFIWSNIDKGNGSPLGTTLFIDGVNGMTGIGTSWPSAKLEVAGNFKATAVGIGIDPPLSTDSYKLFVEGGIAAREVKVTINTFPDYCFADDYKFLSITDLEKYISENKHLPGMPSAKEVAENKGFELGDMQTKLLEKVEEQTLYILDLQKQIDDLKKQMESLIKK